MLAWIMHGRICVHFPQPFGDKKTFGLADFKKAYVYWKCVIVLMMGVELSMFELPSVTTSLEDGVKVATERVMAELNIARCKDVIGDEVLTTIYSLFHPMAEKAANESPRTPVATLPSTTNTSVADLLEQY
jgi:hypothetical protein